MSAGSSEGGGGTGGRRPFFNDRRFTVAGPQRLRQNVQDLLSQFNRQFVADNPHLLHELAEQLNRLQELLSTSETNSANGQQNQHQIGNVPEPSGAGSRQVRNTASTENGQGLSNAPNDLLADFENNINRLANNENQFAADDDDRDEETGREIANRSQEALGNANDSVVLNMEAGDEPDSPVDGAPVAPTDQQAGPAAAAPNGDAEWQRLVTALRAPEMQRISRTVLNFGPFVFILLTKWMLKYAAAIVVLVCLAATFFYAENVIESVVASARSHATSKWRLLSTITLIVLNLGALYYFFADDRLYMALLFQPTEALLQSEHDGLSFLGLLWLIVTTDFVAKFIFMMIKCLVVSGPTLVASHRRKSGTYQWLEYTSHIYRHWLPAVPWSYYLTTTGPKSVGYVHSGMCTVLFLLYLLLKVRLFKPKLSRWWNAMISLMRPSSLGFSPSTSELMKTGPTCSICYGQFTNPVQLSCKHIFCEECVTTWLDKQKTCPMCRTQVVTGDNDWKDGKTSYCLQLV